MPPDDLLPDALRPDWDAPPGIAALMSTRHGGISAAPFHSLNLRPPQLGGNEADDPAAVLENQRRFAQALGAMPVWLDQVHGADAVRLTAADLSSGRPLQRADASISTEPGVACAVLVADCLPVLLCTADGGAVGAAHAGWRGLASGVLERTVQALCAAAGCAPGELLAWLGPCIGPRQFEVGGDVLMAFGVDPATAHDMRFTARPRADGSPRWLADLPRLARDRLSGAGVTRISGGRWCTFEDGSRFFSFRRDRVTGRLAAAIARVG
jgi:YfiH family protein